LQRRWLRSWKFKAKEKVFERQIFAIAHGASEEVQIFREHAVEVGLVQIVLDNLRDV
jgi:hypothetical protein